MFVTELVGNEFKDWQPGSKIIISSPTGSGKSTFILRSLLPDAIKKGKHIVYVCNRKILNDQFAVESRKQLEIILGTAELTEAEAKSIHITTYQHCESEQIFPYISIPPDISGMTRYDRAFAKACATFPKATHCQRR